MKRILLSVGILLGLLSGVAEAKLRVITTTEDLAAITEAIGGPHVQVESLTPGTRDPHFAEAKPSMVRKLFRADLLILVGAELEVGWLPALLRSARNSKVQPGQPGYLDLSTQVELLGKAGGSVDRSMGDVHAAGNPHYWLSPENGRLMARAIALRLAELDKGHAMDFAANLKVFEQRLDARLAKWQTALAPLKGQPVVAYHTSLLYLADAFGFNIVVQVEPKPGIAPSAAHISSLIQQIKQQQIKLLLMEPYYERRSGQLLSDKTGIRVAVIPQSVGAKDGIHSYFDLFDGIVAEIRAAGVL